MGNFKHLDKKELQLIVFGATKDADRIKMKQ